MVKSLKVTCRVFDCWNQNVYKGVIVLFVDLFVVLWTQVTQYTFLPIFHTVPQVAVTHQDLIWFVRYFFMYFSILTLSIKAGFVPEVGVSDSVIVFGSIICLFCFVVFSWQCLIKISVRLKLGGSYLCSMQTFGLSFAFNLFCWSSTYRGFRMGCALPTPYLSLVTCQETKTLLANLPDVKTVDF